MIGEGPAAFYRDACRVMAGSSRFDSTTHLVGHLVREIESALRASLATFRGPVARPQDAKWWNRVLGVLFGILPKFEEGTRKEEIRQIARGLGIPIDDPAIKAWLKLKSPHAFAHRDALFRPRPITAEFDEWWHNVETILYVVLRKFKEERYVEILHEIDRLLAVENPSEVDATFLSNNVPNDSVVLAEFFNRNQNPRWLKLLQKKGFFNYPPDSGRWPQAGYLARMAATDRRTAEYVREIIFKLPNIDNHVVRAELLEGVQAMPAVTAAKLIEKIELWAKETTGFSSEQIAALIPMLAAGSEQQAALRIARAVLEITPAPADEVGLLGRMPRTRPDFWNYEQILIRYFSALVQATGLEALRLLCTLQSDAIRFTLREPEKSAPSDVSHVWRPTVEGSGRDQIPEIKSLLARHVIATASAIVRSKQATLEEVVATLEANRPRWRIFDRIVLYLLSQSDASAANLLAAERLTARDLFDAAECVHEYVALLRQRFRSLRAEQQQEILGWIDAGPLPEHLENVKRNIPQFTGKPVTDEDLVRFTKTWRRDWLQRFADQLPTEKLSDRDALIEELGANERPDLGSYRMEVIGSQSPISLDDLREKSVADQIKYLRDWKPAGDQFLGPSRSGLGELLAKLVVEHPESYATEAERFSEVDPTYQRFLLNGLREAVEKGRGFDWLPVLRLCPHILNQPIEIPDRKALPLDEDQDRTWCRNAIATLLETALRQKQLPIPVELKGELWNVLEALSNDPNPTAEHEAQYGGSNMDPSHLALNSTRGQAIAAVILYARWMCRLIVKEGQVWSFELVPEARKVLEAHLDESFDPSLAVRSVYGRMLVLLFQIDAQWLREKAETIFPSDKAKQSYWEAAWTSYLAFSQVYVDVFELLRPQYQLAVDRLAAPVVLPRLPIDPKQRLAEHLMSLYWSAKIQADGSDLTWDSFWSNAPAESREHAIWFLGRSLYDAKENLAPELLARLQALWESRVSAARAATEPADHVREIVQFGWWFCSGKFPEEWTLEQLESALTLAGHVTPDHFVLEALAGVAGRDPVHAVRCLEKMIDETDRLQLRVHEKEMRQILVEAKKAGGEARTILTHVVNALARIGMPQFRDLSE